MPTLSKDYSVAVDTGSDGQVHDMRKIVGWLENGWAIERAWMSDEGKIINFYLTKQGSAK